MASETSADVSGLSNRGKVLCKADAGIISMEGVVEETVVAGEDVISRGGKSRGG